MPLDLAEHDIKTWDARQVLDIYALREAQETLQEIHDLLSELDDGPQIWGKWAKGGLEDADWMNDELLSQLIIEEMEINLEFYKGCTTTRYQNHLNEDEWEDTTHYTDSEFDWSCEVEEYLEYLNDQFINPRDPAVYYSDDHKHFYVKYKPTVAFQKVTLKEGHNLNDYIAQVQELIDLLSDDFLDMIETIRDGGIYTTDQSIRTILGNLPNLPVLLRDEPVLVPLIRMKDAGEFEGDPELLDKAEE